MKYVYRMMAMGLVWTAALAAQAQTTGNAPLHAWQAAGTVGKAEAYFTNLKSGDVIETPFLLKFGLSGGWGLAPIAASSEGKSGHHHLLVNRDLPLDFKQPLPFNEQYIHFGKGQMETVLTLPPGTYTLRMLLADNKHLPHFVYSKPIKITVKNLNAAVDPKSLSRKGISMVVDKVKTKTSFRVLLHASAMNVAQQAQQQKDTGHFRRTVASKTGGKSAEWDFTNGQTEVWLKPPAGDYTLTLEFLDNLNPAKSLAEAVTTSVQVP